MPVLKYEFEKKEEMSQETGTTDKKQVFGPPGTQFLWQRFSAFGSGDKPKSMEIHEAGERWRLFLETMAVWGKSHNLAYVNCLEHQLGFDLTGIDWSSIPPPERYQKTDLKFDGIKKICIDHQQVLKTDKDAPVIDRGVRGFLLTGDEPSWKMLFADKYSTEFTELTDKFKDKEDKKQVCIILTGSNFKNPKVKLDSVEAKYLLATADGTKLYFIPEDEDYLVLFDRKIASITVINYSDDQRTTEIGSIIFGQKANNETDMGWEENASKVIHDYLKSPEGQQAIRDYKKRGWTPVAPKFRLQVLDEDDKPIEQAVIRVIFKGTDRRKIALTDDKGEVPVYTYSPEDCTVRMEYGSTGSYEVKDIRGLTESTMDLTEHLEGIKIKYLK